MAEQPQKLRTFVVYLRSGSTVNVSIIDRTGGLDSSALLEGTRVKHFMNIQRPVSGEITGAIPYHAIEFIKEMTP